MEVSFLNTPYQQLKIARFHITLELELTELQDQYSYDHKHLGVIARGLDLLANHKTNFGQTSQSSFHSSLYSIVFMCILK